MANISSAQLQSSISEIMKGADLSTISAKKIRNICENKFKVDLTSRKQEIDKIVMSFVASDEDVSEEENNVPSNSDGTDSSASEESDEKPPPKTAKVPPQRTKAMHEIKREKSSKPKKADQDVLNNDSNSEDSSETDDAAVARKLQEEEWNFRRRAAKKMPKESSSRKKKSDDSKPKIRKGSTYTRKCTLSPELAEVMEANEMARPDVVKKMWSIVRERNLFDPANKQFAICDEQLKKVVGTKRFRIFGMMKYLKNHMKDQN